MIINIIILCGLCGLLGYIIGDQRSIKQIKFINDMWEKKYYELKQEVLENWEK